MAPRKKPKLTAQPRFARLKIVAVGASKPQRELWAGKIGRGFVAVARSDVFKGALERHADATHVVSCLGADPALAERSRDDAGLAPRHRGPSGPETRAGLDRMSTL